MPGPKTKPPRLYLRPDERVWVILDSGKQNRTGCGEHDTEGAARALETYLGERHTPTIGERDPSVIAIADVLTAYAESKEPKGKDPDQLRRYDELVSRIERLVEWWGDKMLAAVHKTNCEAYVEWRIKQPRRHAKSEAAIVVPITMGTARRDLEDMRAAIRDYHRRHLLNAVPVVSLPPKGEGRQDWLTRNMAARLLGAAIGFVWDISKGDWAIQDSPDGHRRLHIRRNWATRTRRRHAARFILLGLYSGRREATIRRTQWLPSISGPWLDLDRMIYHGRGSAEAKTNKRRPPAAIAYRLRPHLRRWARLDAALADRIQTPVQFVVHRPAGGPLKGKIKTGWRAILRDAGLGPEFVRHVMRHTAATWQMQAATDPWKAAGFLGMTVKTLLETYGHHHPEFQQEAAAAFGGKK